MKVFVAGATGAMGKPWIRAGRLLPGASIEIASVNGGPGALLPGGRRRLISVWSIEFAGDQVQSIRSTVNPDKLAHLGPVAEWTEGLRPPAPRAAVAPPRASSRPPWWRS